MENSIRTKRYWLGVPLWLLVLACGPRVAALGLLPDSFLRSPNDDPDDYARFAQTLRRHGVYGPAENLPSAYRPPFYPLLLAPWRGESTLFVGGVFLLHMLATWWMLRCTMRWAEGVVAQKWRVIPPLLVALDPLLIRQFTVVMSETVFTALITWYIAFFYSNQVTWRGHLKSAILLALAALTRPTAWVVWLALALPAWQRQQFKHWLAVGMGALLLTTPWAWRNHLWVGRWTWTTTHGGYTLWLGMNPVYYSDVVMKEQNIWPQDSFTAWTLENERATLGMDEPARDSYFRQQALGWMMQHPGAALHTALLHVYSFWAPAPRYGPRLARWGCGLYYCTLYFFVATAMFSRYYWRRGWHLACIPLALTFVHSLYWSDIRMRAPIMPVLVILAVSGWRGKNVATTDGRAESDLVKYP